MLLFICRMSQDLQLEIRLFRSSGCHNCDVFGNTNLIMYNDLQSEFRPTFHAISCRGKLTVKMNFSCQNNPAVSLFLKGNYSNSTKSLSAKRLKSGFWRHTQDANLHPCNMEMLSGCHNNERHRSSRGLTSAILLQPHNVAV